jgi:hypothetical protein
MRLKGRLFKGLIVNSTPFNGFPGPVFHFCFPGPPKPGHFAEFGV